LTSDVNSWDNIIDLDRMWVELKRIGKENTPFIFFCSIMLASKLISSNPKMFKYDLVWCKSKATNQVHGYPTAGRTYNSMWDVQHRLPIFTKSKKSKSWFAAGWYRVKSGRRWQTCQDPKLIVLQRYPYAGPFLTKEAADEHTSTTLC
jgi:hypothetical protein